MYRKNRRDGERSGVPRHLAEVLAQSALLAPLIARSRLHQTITEAVRAHLPGSLATHCLSCVAHADRLVVFTDSATLATPLRFALGAILPSIRERFSADWRVAQVRIFPTWQPDRRLRELLPSPAATADQPARAARGAPSADLQEALQRLAATLRGAAPDAQDGTTAQPKPDIPADANTAEANAAARPRPRTALPL